ncbi:MAG TPA: DUF4160 domain-containing protein [Steroidobacteraceae bacterium]
MPTILSFGRLRVLIYLNDHPPPHVHVIGAGSEARIALGGEGERASLITNKGLSKRELKKALAKIDENRALLLQRWREIHGNA